MRESGEVMGITAMLRKTDTLDKVYNCKLMRRILIHGYSETHIQGAIINTLMHINKLSFHVCALHTKITNSICHMIKTYSTLIYLYASFILIFLLVAISYIGLLSLCYKFC